MSGDVYVSTELPNVRQRHSVLEAVQAGACRRLTYGDDTRTSRGQQDLDLSRVQSNPAFIWDTFLACVHFFWGPGENSGRVVTWKIYALSSRAFPQEFDGST
eukprot:2533135-Amphidinium_carterae.1